MTMTIIEKSKTNDPGTAVPKEFEEINKGMNTDSALVEASRCLQCHAPPCRKNCPVDIDIPAFVRRIRDRDLAGAAQKIRESNVLGGICARICPVDRLCEMECTRKKMDRAINIHGLQRFAADWEEDNWKKRPAVAELGGKRVAVVGAGPAGLACAFELRKMGIAVKVFEKRDDPGGIPSWGIPSFRVPRNIVRSETDFVIRTGIELECGTEIERLDDLGDYDAVFLGSGLGVDPEYPVEGCTDALFHSNRFLDKAARGGLSFLDGKKVGVIGGGDVAFDVARTAMRYGAQCTILYRRTFREMPAERDEIESAIAEGIDFKLLTTVTSMKKESDGNLHAVCQVMELGEKDGSGRKRPVPVEGARYLIRCDYLVAAIGSKPDVPFHTGNGIELDGRGRVRTSKDMMTGRRGVFAGGDLANRDNTVVGAVADGKRAAAAILSYLGGDE